MSNLFAKFGTNFCSSKNHLNKTMSKFHDPVKNNARALLNSDKRNCQLQVMKSDTKIWEEHGHKYLSEQVDSTRRENFSRRIEDSISNHLTVKSKLKDLGKDFSSLENRYTEYTRRFRNYSNKKNDESKLKSIEVEKNMDNIYKIDYNKNKDFFKENYDTAVEMYYPDFPITHCHYEDTTRYKGKNEEYYFIMGVESLRNRGEMLKTGSHELNLSGLKPSDYATILGAGVKADLRQELNEMKVGDNKRVVWQNMISKLSDFEVGVLCLDTRPHNATGMKTNEGLSFNEIYNNNYDLNQEKYNQVQILNSLFISDLYRKHSKLEISSLLYRMGDYERDIFQNKPYEVVVYRKSDPRGSLKKKIEEAGEKKTEVQFVSENIAYTTVISPESNRMRPDDPSSDESHLLNAYKGDYLFRIKVKPGTACFVDPFSVSKSREVVIPAGTPMIIKDVTEQRGKPYKYEVVMETVVE